MGKQARFRAARRVLRAEVNNGYREPDEAVDLYRDVKAGRRVVADMTNVSQRLLEAGALLGELAAARGASKNDPAGDQVDPAYDTGAARFREAGWGGE